jgi:hypothetical protein
MRRFEARFFPSHPPNSNYIVVGQVICELDRAAYERRVVPSPSLRQANAPAVILATLRHLVRLNGPESFGELETLSGRSWSFVEVTSTTADDAAVTPG